MSKIDSDDIVELTDAADTDKVLGYRPASVALGNRWTFATLWAFFRAKLTATPVTIAEGGTGAATAAAARTALGLGNVDNTSDANKPVSTAQATAIALKLDASEKGAPGGVARADLSNEGAQAALSAYHDVSHAIFGREYMHAWYALLCAQTATSTAPRVMFSGDSTTQGSGIVYANNKFEAMFREFLLTKIPNVSSLNRGYAGEDTQDWLDTRLPADLALSPDLYFVRWGLNDAPDVETYIARIETGLSTIRASRGVGSLSVVLMTPNTSDEGARTPSWHIAISSGLRALARAYQCAFIDTYALATDADGAGLWLDSIKLHPTDSLNISIGQAMAELVYPRSLEAFSWSQQRNISSTYGTPTAANAPSAYPENIGFYRATAGGGWPHDGIFQTVKQANGYWAQWNFGSDGSVSVRTAANSTTWNSWISLNSLVYQSAGGVIDANSGVNVDGTGVSSPPSGVNYGLFPYQGVGTGFASAAIGYGWFVGNTLHASLRSDTGFSLRGTNIAVGTTGAQTINRPVGIVNFAAAATSLVVTNSMVNTASVVIPVLRTNDATAVLGAAVCGSGSFTLNMKTAPTAETSVGFVVVNPILN